MQQAWKMERQLARLVPQTGLPAAGVGHLGGSAILVGLGGVYVILQPAWKLGGLCINDQMQIVPGGPACFPQILPDCTQEQAKGLC